MVLSTSYWSGHVGKLYVSDTKEVGGPYVIPYITHQKPGKPAKLRGGRRLSTAPGLVSEVAQRGLIRGMAGTDREGPRHRVAAGQHRANKLAVSSHFTSIGPPRESCKPPVKQSVIGIPQLSLYLRGHSTY